MGRVKTLTIETVSPGALKGEASATAVNAPGMHQALATAVRPVRCRPIAAAGQPAVGRVRAIGARPARDAQRRPVRHSAASPHLGGVTSGTALTPAGASQPFKLIRLGTGHFAASASLTPGRWTFRVDAIAAGGQPLSGYFSQTIPVPR